jgi:hypothetical protein
MTRTAEIKSLSQPCRTIAEISVERIARTAAESSRRHTAQFTNLAALARTIQKYIPAGAPRQQKDFADLARTMVDCAEFYKDRAVAEDVFFSLIATDTLDLFDPDVRADVLRRAEAGKSSNVKRAVAADQLVTVRH